MEDGITHIGEIRDGCLLEKKGNMSICKIYYDDEHTQLWQEYHIYFGDKKDSNRIISLVHLYGSKNLKFSTGFQKGVRENLKSSRLINFGQQKVF